MWWLFYKNPFYLCFNWNNSKWPFDAHIFFRNENWLRKQRNNKIKYLLNDIFSKWRIKIRRLFCLISASFCLYRSQGVFVFIQILDIPFTVIGLHCPFWLLWTDILKICDLSTKNIFHRMLIMSIFNIIAKSKTNSNEKTVVSNKGNKPLFYPVRKIT